MRAAQWCTRFKLCLGLALFLGGWGRLSAFESDVHFGLTQWLALQAGYAPADAAAIATGDRRVDSGDTHFIELAFDYACANADSADSVSVQAHHFPSDARLPAAPAARLVAAGSPSAWAKVNELAATPPDQVSIMLLTFGAALHPLQDSWSNQGVPDTPQPFAGAVHCDASLTWASPALRGGWVSHRADLTWLWPEETLAMAEATYRALLNYPRGLRRVHPAMPWSAIVPLLQGFIQAQTKTDKKQWFAARGIMDASFLDGVSLRDGAERFTSTWPGLRLPSLEDLRSGQWATDSDLRDDMSRFFADWIAADRLDVSAHHAAGAKARAEGPIRSMGSRELGARLRLWRVRDHGKVAAMLHQHGALTSSQLAEAQRITRVQSDLVAYANPAEAFLPLLIKTHKGSNLTPFFLVPLSPPTSRLPQALVAFKLRHAPYDTVALVVEKVNASWRVISVDAVVEH